MTRSGVVTWLCRETNLFDLLFKSLLQVFVAPDELVKDLKGGELLYYP